MARELMQRVGEKEDIRNGSFVMQPNSSGRELPFFFVFTIVTEQDEQKMPTSATNKNCSPNLIKFNLGHPVPVHLALCSGYRTLKNFPTPNRNLVNPQLLTRLLCNTWLFSFHCLIGNPPDGRFNDPENGGHLFGCTWRIHHDKACRHKSLKPAATS